MDSLPVVDADGTLVAVITDRDVCMAEFPKGARFDEFRVSDGMSRKVHIVREDNRLAVVADAMRVRRAAKPQERLSRRAARSVSGSRQPRRGVDPPPEGPARPGRDPALCARWTRRVAGNGRLG